MDRNDHLPTAARSIPNRRQFLQIGGASVAAAALLAACGSPDKNVQLSGTTVTTAVPPTAPPASANADQQATDQALLRTATSLELLIVKVYDDISAKALVTDAEHRSMLTRFRDQHEASAKVLATATTGAGGTAYDKANEYLQTNLVTPGMATVTDEASALRFARQLEQIATATYTQAAAQLSGPKLRQTAMSIGGATARQVTVLNLVVADGDLAAGVADARFTTRDAVGNTARVS
jgi:hypothetical protein